MHNISLTSDELDQITTLMVHLEDTISRPGNFKSVRVGKVFVEVLDQDGEVLGHVAQHHPEDPYVLRAGQGIEWLPADGEQWIGGEGAATGDGTFYDQEND